MTGKAARWVECRVCGEGFSPRTGLAALEADIPVFVEGDVSVSQVVQALRGAGLAMRLDLTRASS
jgi:hypothetical protein